jgi:hypothetical protein
VSKIQNGSVSDLNYISYKFFSIIKKDLFYLGQSNQQDYEVDMAPIFQFILFLFFSIVVWFGAVPYIHSIQIEYQTYSFTNARLITFKTTLITGCSNLTNLPCSLQMYINNYFFWTKFILIYYSSIVITMIYIWHRTVRLSACIFAFFVIVDIVFGSDRILAQDKILHISSMICSALVIAFFHLTMFMPLNFEDPLSIHCGPGEPSIDRVEFLQTNTSKRARFYRWIHRMKNQWNIEEEKLIVTTIVAVLTTSFCMISCSIIFYLCDDLLLHIGSFS